MTTQRRPCPVCAGSAVVPGTRDLPCPTCAPGRLAAITPRAHTPGPWTIQQVAPKKWCIFGAVDQSPNCATAHTEADARLIAASPDLLAALEAWPGASTSGEEYKRLHHWLDNVVAPAIRKAQEG